MSAQDLPEMNFRSFVDSLRDDGDLAVINLEIDPHLEAAAITRKAMDTMDQAPLFNNVRGAKHGFCRILGAPGALRHDESVRNARIARHLGLPPTASLADIMDKVIAAKSAKPIAPTIVKTGSCKENKISGDEIDLTALPIPLLHEKDGGAYIQTYGMHVLQDPSHTWNSWSLQRAHVNGKRTLATLAVAPEHTHAMLSQYQTKGEDMPWALALGVPPAAIIAASMPLPEGVSEGDYVGAMVGHSVDVVKCETNDLYVPANSEIVLEGKITISQVTREGPFGEMHGYLFPGLTVPGMPLVEVDCITYRNDPILPICPAGRAVDETHTLIGLLASTEIKHVCQLENLPIKQVFTPFETHIVWVVLQVDTAKLRAMHTNSADFCRRVGDVLLRRYTKPSFFIHRFLLVGDDIDPFNFNEVMWAYATRCRPGMDEYLYDDVDGFFLVPYMGRGPGPVAKGGKMISNCLLPIEYTGGPDWITCDFEKGYPQDIQDRVNKKWSQMGFRQ